MHLVEAREQVCVPEPQAVQADMPGRGP
jgi:hypothetical protein